MPILAQLEERDVCWLDQEFAFVSNEVSYMFDTALKKVSDMGACTCALESVEDVRKFMQIRFLGHFVRFELL